VWQTSDKREYAARTIRSKIHKQLPTFLEQFPELPSMPSWDGDAPNIEWDSIIEEVVKKGMMTVHASEGQVER
jgi:deoxyribodipyrimidine photo-lyase